MCAGWILKCLSFVTMYLNSISGVSLTCLKTVYLQYEVVQEVSSLNVTHYLINTYSTAFL